MGWLFNPVEALAVLVLLPVIKVLLLPAEVSLASLTMCRLNDIIIYSLCFVLCKNYIMSMVCVPVSAKNSGKEGILDEK